MKKIEMDKILKTDMTTIDHKHLCNAKTYNAINGIIHHINETMNEGEFDEVQALMIYKSIIDAVKVPIGQIKESLKYEELSDQIEELEMWNLCEINEVEELDYPQKLKFNPIEIDGCSSIVLICEECKKILNDNGSFHGIVDHNLDRFYAYLCMFCGHKSLYSMDYAPAPLNVGSWGYDDYGKIIASFDKPDPTYSWPNWKKRLANMDSNCNDCDYKGESPISGDHCEGCRNGDNHSKRNKS